MLPKKLPSAFTCFSISALIEDAEIVLALIDRYAHFTRAEATVDGHIQAAFFEKAHFLCNKGIAERAEWQPRQRELDRGLGTLRQGRNRLVQCAPKSEGTGILQERT